MRTVYIRGTNIVRRTTTRRRGARRPAIQIIVIQIHIDLLRLLLSDIEGGQEYPTLWNEQWIKVKEEIETLNTILS